MLGRAVFLAIAVAAFAAAPALAQHHRHAHHQRHHNGDHSAPLKAVYTEDNLPASSGGNHLLVFARGSDGTIPREPSQVVPTGGVGLASQPPFGFPMVDSQGALDITTNGRLLFAVNAGSNTISAFKVNSTGPHLVDTIDSGGTEPISITHAGRLLYVLNEASGNIAGFRFSDDGDLSAIPHSSQSLATPGAAGVSAQIGFSPDARFLTVTERCFQGCPLAPFGLIDTFRMGWDGRPGPVHAQSGDAPIPFGFAYQGRHLITTYVGYVATPSGDPTTNPGDPTQFNGFIGSDTLNQWGGLSPNGTVPAGGAFRVGRGTCWIVITGDGKYGFVTNSLSDTLPNIASGHGAISRIALSPSGQVTVLQPLTNASPDAAGGPAFPTDLGLSSDSKFLYVAVPTLNQPPPTINNTSHIDAYAVGSDGSLTQLPPTNSDLAGGISGIVSH